jgi:glycosyltransferase involved in cell wall biosynthesis
MLEQGGRGGVADYTTELIAALPPEGQPVEFVTATDSLIPVGPGVTEHRWMRYFRGTSAWRRAVRGAHLGPTINGVLYLLQIPRMTSLARRRCRAVHVQGGFPPLTLAFTLVLKLAGVPVVHTPHNTFDRGPQFGSMRRWVALLVDKTIVHAHADLPNLPPSARRRAVVIPHGEYGGLARAGGKADRAAARRDLGLAAGEPAVLLFGQLRPDKGVRDLLVAASAVVGLHVILAGEDLGALKESADLLADPKLAARVIVREGFQSLQDAASLFAAADAAALPYQVASQSGVLLLSYAFARPVVVYPVGGLPEAVVDGETGWICARRDPEALADTLRDVVAAGSEECLRRGEAGARLATERFAWPVIAAETIGVYDVVSG